MAFLLFQLTGFGSPLDNDDVRRFADAVKHVGLNLPTPFYTELTGKPKDDFIEKANIVVNMWKNKQIDSRTKKLMEHMIMSLNISGDDADKKIIKLTDMVSLAYKVPIGSSDALAAKSILDNKSNRAQSALSNMG